jgi:hypothetical protein
MRSSSKARRAWVVAGICGTSTGGGTGSEHPSAIRHFEPPQTPNQHILGVSLLALNISD